MKSLPYGQFQCEICGYAYTLQRIAEICENAGPVEGDVKVGDIIAVKPNTFFYQNGVDNEHEVIGIKISQGYNLIQAGHRRMPIIRHSRFGDVFLLLSEFTVVLANCPPPKFERAVRI